MNARRFEQSPVELRNTIRHSRSLTDITVKNSDAALLWFGAVLDSAKSAE